MPAAATKLTVAEYAALEPPAGGRWELRHGEPVQVTFPKPLHNEIQHRLVDLLKARLSGEWTVRMEMAFRPRSEYEVWSADVAVVESSRRRLDEWLSGAPEIVVEVLSPSNTASEMLDRERTCFEGGAREFWIVDPALMLVRVSRADGSTATYVSGQQVPLVVAGPGAIGVDEIFSV